MDCYNLTLNSGVLLWIRIDTAAIILILPCFPLLLIYAIYQTKNLHRNYRFIMINICILFIIRILAQVLSNIYYGATLNMHIECKYMLLPSRCFILAVLSMIPCLLIERVIATCFYINYEKKKYFRCISYVATLLQIAMVSILYPDKPIVIRELFCSTKYTLTILCMGALQIACVPLTIIVRQFNFKIRKALKNGQRISGRYQIRENAKTCRSLCFASIGSSIWILFYGLSQLHVTNCIRENIIPPYDFVNNLYLCILLIIIVLSHAQIRRKFLQTLGLHNSLFFSRLMCTLPKQRYRVNDQQRISSTSQNSHFESLSRQWNQDINTNQQWNGEEAQRAAP